jgi:hypothetical protein
MFLFESIPWQAAIMFLVVLLVLMLLNELAGFNKWTAIFFFGALPLFLTIAVWPKTAVEGTSVATWFHWAKVYSALSGAIVVSLIRFKKGLVEKKWILILPAAILTINIAEAVIRDFQCYSYNGIVDGLMIVGGPWNIMNGIAGILNILAISGWFGIFISKNKAKDMIWPDMLWFWIIAYDLWNFAYIYNCVPLHAFYAGVALLASCTIPSLFIRKGTWFQARAYTLTFWMMFVMIFPAFQDTTIFTVKSSHNPKALFAVSLIALLMNIVLVIYHFTKILRNNINLFKQDVHADLGIYKRITDANR